MLPADAKLGLILAGERDMPLRAEALELFEGARSQAIAQRTESFQALTSPRGHVLRVLQSARDLVAALAGLHRQYKLHSFELGQARERRSRGGWGAFSRNPASGFIERLR